ncbi:ABC transporter ATP-binding protein [Paracoccus sediminicola]|uniref:ABC transporter ATP-binding protein n=1 Tax=Paracoccus sediminicola TaxID=3017783 RepID=UPI0022F09529|nr:ABC transporter ATP-binding protein [Paracoccus sediminicola]WBU56809.1 ABC transporter ATP-binding protein [Paracoccus sediminicola]
MLELSEVSAGYGPVQALFGLDLRVAQGTLHALLGRNGAGKTTALRRIMGLLPHQGGRIMFDGQEITRWPTPRIARAGIGFVPERREVFASLTLRENLTLAGRIGRGSWDVERVLALFPQLEARLDARAGVLSGGEQQMLAIGRALMLSPRLLLLDEPTEGLAPPMVDALREALAALRENGLTLLMVEQNIGFASTLADRVTLVSRGQAVWTGEAAEFAGAQELRQRHLGV